MENAHSREELEALAKFPEENPNPVMRIDHAGKILYCNQAGITMLEENGIHSCRSIPSWLLEKLLSTFSKGNTEEVLFGSTYYRILTSKVSHSDSVFLFWQEVSLQKKYEALLHLSNSVIENTIEGIFVTDEEGTIERVNPAFSHITGFEPSEAIGENPRILKSNHQSRDFYAHMWEEISTRGYWSGEIWNRRKDGEAISLWLSITSIYDFAQQSRKYVAVFHDISRIKHTEEKLQHQTYYDPLTNLPNRQLFYDRLNTSIASAKRSSHRIAVLLMDIDNFKKINDSLGPQLGDGFLRTIGERLRAITREEDTIARLGGDEFALLNVHIHNQNEVLDILSRVRAEITKALPVGEHEIVPSASIGVSFYPDDGTDADTLLKNADLAMYKAKGSERGSYALFNPILHDQAQRRIELETNLNRGLGRNEFVLHYQPKIDLKSLRPKGFEALIRWQRNGTTVSPADFIPVAEETGLIFPLGRHIMRQACSDLLILNGERVNKGRDGGLCMAVNLSAKQFQDTGLVAQLREIIEETGVDPGLMSVEITENTAVSDVNSALHMMKEISSSGINISIDDFGTGYSSLAYVKRFTAEELKIDKSFIEDLPSDPGDRAIVQAVVSMAHTIGMQVVAEGVETKEQLEYLGSIGCDTVQGYYFSKPLPIEELIIFLEGVRPPKRDLLY